MSGPLDGVLVVSIEQAVAAPFCTCRLADAGARVIKIERPEGDFARHYDSLALGQSAYFVWLNRGKESVCLDLTQPADRDLVLAMIARADVVLENLKPGALERLGIDLDALCAAHPRLIACSISGFAADGPNRDRKAYDLLIQAETGLASITGAPAEAGRVGVSACDVATGMYANQAILEALVGRAASGRGARLEVAMFDAIADWMTVPLMQLEYGVRMPGRVGLGHPTIVPYGVFATADGRQLLVGLQNDREWQALATRVMGRPELALDPRFATNRARTQHRTETDAAVAAAIGALPRDAAVAALEAAGLAWADYNDVGGLSRHPDLRRIAVEAAGATISMPAPPVRIGGQTRVAEHVPALGEHTEAVRREFGG